MSSAIHSASFISAHWFMWQLLGAAYTQVSWHGFYWFYALLINLLVTLYYPLHLGVKVFSNATIKDDIINLTTFVVTLSCSLKILIYSYNLQKVRQMEHLLATLDSRVKGAAQRHIYDQLSKQLRNILYVFIALYLPVAVFAEMSFVFQEERKLLYPGWFPYNWYNSTLNFYLTHVYQIVGIFIQIAQNYVSDCFPAVMLCLISAHTKMLYKRMEDIGVSLKSDAELQPQLAETELEACITDHKQLLELFDLMESFMSWPMLIQFAASALNICISIAGMLFFVTEPMARAYFFFYALAMPMQIFPICYYGTDTVVWFGKLHYAAFSCNWLTQRRSFKRKLMLFVERSLRHNAARAGGMIRIHVDAFFGTLKFAYSLFTILLRMRK
ncbi:Or59a [Drosophila busckii]|uniref:Odorant receptor n=1 Tax=Drosophila busckii TaxID=30019 RepID=A0A0M5J012_DROBS|nr:odorant receptor 59a [Drosophila busckii]ALC41698.1 Or59a [Drosophila busckii]